jgi:GAF domain-containing protein
MVRLRDIPSRKWFRLRCRGYAFIVAAFAGFFASVLIEEKQYPTAAVFAVFVLLAAVAEFVLADILTEEIYPAKTQTLLGRLQDNLRLYHDHIRASIGRAIEDLAGCDKAKISGTFHLVVELYRVTGDGTDEALVQVTDYSGRLGGERWRFNSATKGIIGRCLRTGESEWVNFASEDDYTDRMIREFGYTKNEMLTHTRAARSYWAEPVYARNKLIGVMFLFSTEIQVFPYSVQSHHMRAHAREISSYLEGAEIV